MTCAGCKWHYISTFENRPTMACLALNGCRGIDIGAQVRAHVISKAPLFLAAPDCADACPGFEQGPAIYREAI